jgi:hypothetical protein
MPIFSCPERANALILLQTWKSGPTNHLTCCAPAANGRFIAFSKAKHGWLHVSAATSLGLILVITKMGNFLI